MVLHPERARSDEDTSVNGNAGGLSAWHSLQYVPARFAKLADSFGLRWSPGNMAVL